MGWGGERRVSADWLVVKALAHQANCLTSVQKGTGLAFLYDFSLACNGGTKERKKLGV